MATYLLDLHCLMTIHDAARVCRRAGLAVHPDDDLFSFHRRQSLARFRQRHEVHEVSSIDGLPGLASLSATPGAAVQYQIVSVHWHWLSESATCLPDLLSFLSVAPRATCAASRSKTTAKIRMVLNLLFAVGRN